MPVVWTAETESKLLAGLFHICDIKVNTAQKAELAKIIGPECTPKAITHRLDKFKKAAASFAPKTPAPPPKPEAGLQKVLDDHNNSCGKKRQAPKFTESVVQSARVAEESEEDLDEEVKAKRVKVKIEEGEVEEARVEEGEDSDRFF